MLRYFLGPSTSSADAVKGLRESDSLSSTVMAFGERVQSKAARTELARSLNAARWSQTKRGSDEAATPMTDAQRAACLELSHAARQFRTGRPHTSPRKSEPNLRVSSSGNRLVYADSALRDTVPPDRATGARVQDMALLDSTMAPHLSCPKCERRGTLRCTQNNQVDRAGLGGNLQWWCSRCKANTITLPMSRTLPRPMGASGPALQEVNARLVTASVQAGLGREGAALFAAVLDVPAPSHNCWDNAAARAYEAMEETGEASAKKALLEERVEAVAQGKGPDENGETGIIVSTDGRWPKRGRAHNSLDGYVHATGELTGKVVDYSYRTKVGKLKNHAKSSKAMEPDMTCEIIQRLNEDDNGVVVEGLCMDLDSATRAHVRELCEKEGFDEPRKLVDPNHFQKALKGAFLTIKTQLGVRGAFGADAQATSSPHPHPVSRDSHPPSTCVT